MSLVSYPGNRGLNMPMDWHFRIFLTYFERFIHNSQIREGIVWLGWHVLRSLIHSPIQFSALWTCNLDDSKQKLNGCTMLLKFTDNDLDFGFSGRTICFFVFVLLSFWLEVANTLLILKWIQYCASTRPSLPYLYLDGSFRLFHFLLLFGSEWP